MLGSYPTYYVRPYPVYGSMGYLPQTQYYAPMTNPQTATYPAQKALPKKSKSGSSQRTHHSRQPHDDVHHHTRHHSYSHHHHHHDDHYYYESQKRDYRYPRNNYTQTSASLVLKTDLADEVSSAKRLTPTKFREGAQKKEIPSLELWRSSPIRECPTPVQFDEQADLNSYRKGKSVIFVDSHHTHYRSPPMVHRKDPMPPSKGIQKPYSNQGPTNYKR